MSKRYTYSRSIKTQEGEETFTADQFDSFDEAIKIVDKGIYDRKLELKVRFTPKETGLSATLNRPEMTIKYDADGNVIK